MVCAHASLTPPKRNAAPKAKTLGAARWLAWWGLTACDQNLKMREEIKKQTIRKRRLQHQAAAA